MKNGRIAVPSNGAGGLDGTRAGHFGHCDVFTFIDVEDGEIKNVSVLQNEEHVQGGCMVPVNLEGKMVRKHACIDGPELDSHIIDWDKFLPRFLQFREKEENNKIRHGFS